jgi:hypothetical protein
LVPSWALIGAGQPPPPPASESPTTHAPCEYPSRTKRWFGHAADRSVSRCVSSDLPALTLFTQSDVAG